MNDDSTVGGRAALVEAYNKARATCSSAMSAEHAAAAEHVAAKSSESDAALHRAIGVANAARAEMHRTREELQAWDRWAPAVIGFGAASMDQAWSRALDLIRADGLDPEAVLAAAAETVKAWKMGPPPAPTADAAVELAGLPTLNDLLWRLPEEIRRALRGGDPTRWRLARAVELLLAERERLTAEHTELAASVERWAALADENGDTSREHCAEVERLRAEVGKLDTLWRALIVERDGEAERADEAEAAVSAADVTIAALRADLAEAQAAHVAERDSRRGACERILELADEKEAARAAGAKEERDAWTEVTGADSAQALAAELDVARAKRRAGSGE